MIHPMIPSCQLQVVIICATHPLLKYTACFGLLLFALFLDIGVLLIYSITLTLAELSDAKLLKSALSRLERPTYSNM